MKTQSVVKAIVKEQPVEVKEAVSSILKQKIAKQFKETVKG